jgi:hypothetical protein
MSQFFGGFGLGDVCNYTDPDYDPGLCADAGGTVINAPNAPAPGSVQTCAQAGLPDMCWDGSFCSLGLWPTTQGCPPKTQAAPTAPTHAAAPAASSSGGGGGYNVNAAYGQSNTGYMPQAPLAPANALTPGASTIATSLSLPTTIPNWVFYVAGGVLVLGIGILIYKHKRSGLAGYEGADYDEDYEDEQDDQEAEEA